MPAKSTAVTALREHLTQQPDDSFTQHRHRMPFGAELQADGSTRFRLWAPAHTAVALAIDGIDTPLRLQQAPGGWHELTTAAAIAGTRYRFVLSDGLRIGDPASRFQPADAHGPSEVIDPAAYEWRHLEWRGRPWASAVLYELHVGAFTTQGTFRAAIDKLDHLARLGVTAIQIMPVAEFPGSCNWGYDGVMPFAPDSTYGRPEDFKAFVDAAHGKGLMVLLDVVYNHFGPDGNFFPACTPAIFTDRHHTPWGTAINYDGPESPTVRELVVHNALYWIEEFQLDGLRLDAVHAILDDSPKHVLVELAERVRAAAADREVHLLVENEENEASLLGRDERGRPRLFDAQWNDDVHHALHAAVTGEDSGYYAEYRGDAHKLGRALAEGFAFQGEVMAFRGSARGDASAHLPPLAFVAFLQNHDQIGNRAFGERLGALAPAEAVQAAAAVYLLLPQVPMLFMGEEWDAAQPFQFFCDFADPLGQQVCHGRRAEFAKFPQFADPHTRHRIPSPCAPQTYVASKLVWEDCATPRHAERLDRYRRLLEVRHREIVPRLPSIASAGRYEVLGPSAVAVRWTIDGGGELVLTANLSSEPAALPACVGRELWREGTVTGDGAHAPWSVRWAVTEPASADVAAGGGGEALLEELAQRCGVDCDLADPRGEPHSVPADTLRAILRSLGVLDERGTAAALARLEREHWDRATDTVHVAIADTAIAVAVRLPRDTREVRWRVTLEHGEERSGSMPFAKLALDDAREIDGRAYERRRLELAALPVGYHRLTVQPGDRTTQLIATPGKCWLPSADPNERFWGVTAQLYLVRSQRNWGIGDYADLQALMRLVHERGGDTVGVNPLHAMFTDNPEHASPYSPASRLLLNVLNIDVEAVPEWRTSAAARKLAANANFQARLARCRAASLVDYRQVAALKQEALELLFAEARAGDNERWRELEQFRRERGELFERHCAFLALRAHFARQSQEQADWRRWPAEFRDCRSNAVAEFASAHRDEIAYVAWLQWLADRQLRAAVEAEPGMRLGLYCDLAVGADSSGAETWSEPELVAPRMQIGAPPDPMNARGQGWGVPPFNPRSIREQAYRSFIALLRANMRHAGALRIDHVMALERLFFVPDGKEPADGAYVSYPSTDLIGILALESHRNRCMIIGEDLGTVPVGFRERMAEANILSYRVLMFEREQGGRAFVPPEHYPAHALAVAGNHDLPTLRGWWNARDIALQDELEDCAPEQLEHRRRERDEDRHALVAVLRAAGLVSADAEPSLPQLATAVHALLGRTPSLLALAQLDDIMLEEDPVNTPSTQRYPNWRRRLAASLEAFGADPLWRAVADALGAERGPAARAAGR